MEPAKRKRGRPPQQSPAEQPAPSLKLTAQADRLLTVHSKKLKLSKRAYASAAVAYFATTGLNPTKEQPKGLASVALKVDEETLAIRAQNVDIGNRLISLLRGWERNLYSFLQQQQQTTYDYLEQIEANMLQHQGTVETILLAPMVEQLFKVNLEAFITRD
ncbi:hypothetical protein [Hymenobacter sp. BRD67]|uniref:hypothetical protein n=1 Tax=Hymenobacter sp. BRD67 TaxID=2675877 RepID=UPI001566499B|nr:hypothetical protein [Hymenobacter sp. BRD67]QKG55087.1 hypothetical protein GKZ67_21950 [Hymenobacter sp. BRD67]